MEHLETKGERRAQRRQKRWPVHGRGFVHIVNAVRNRAEEIKRTETKRGK